MSLKACTGYAVILLRRGMNRSKRLENFLIFTMEPHFILAEDCDQSAQALNGKLIG